MCGANNIYVEKVIRALHARGDVLTCVKQILLLLTVYYRGEEQLV